MRKITQDDAMEKLGSKTMFERKEYEKLLKIAREDVPEDSYEIIAEETIEIKGEEYTIIVEHCRSRSFSLTETTKIFVIKENNKEIS